MIEPKQEFHFEIHGISDSPRAYTAKATLSERLKYFEGHFPGQPVLPAVAIIDACLESLVVALGTQAHLSKIKSSKFTAALTSGDNVTINVVQEDPYLWNFKWYTRNNIAADLYLDIATDFALGC